MSYSFIFPHPPEDEKKKKDIPPDRDAVAWNDSSLIEPRKIPLSQAECVNSYLRKTYYLPLNTTPKWPKQSNGTRLPPCSVLGACHAVGAFLRIQLRSAYYLCRLTFPFIYYYYVSSMFLFFSTAVFFPFSLRLFLAYPRHHSSPHDTQPPFLRFFRLPNSSIKYSNTYLHI